MSKLPQIKKLGKGIEAASIIIWHIAKLEVVNQNQNLDKFFEAGLLKELITMKFRSI